MLVELLEPKGWPRYCPDVLAGGLFLCSTIVCHSVLVELLEPRGWPQVLSRRCCGWPVPLAKFDVDLQEFTEWVKAETAKESDASKQDLVRGLLRVLHMVAIEGRDTAIQHQTHASKPELLAGLYMQGVHRKLVASCFFVVPRQFLTHKSFTQMLLHSTCIHTHVIAQLMQGCSKCRFLMSSTAGRTSAFGH